MSELLWHHGKISKEEAVRRFRQFHPDGSYLMRNSETVMNAFVLSVGFQNNVYHYRILQDTSRRFLFENRIYYSLAEIVEYYGKNRGCLVCTLKHPVLPPLPTGLGDLHVYDQPTSSPMTNGEYDQPTSSPMSNEFPGDRGYERRDSSNYGS